MQEESELLKAVLDNPDHDAPRLAFADWCEQQDAPSSRARAEFIRKQISLSRLPPDSDPREGYFLKEDIFDLETAFAASSDRRIAALAPDPFYYRGLIE